MGDAFDGIDTYMGYGAVLPYVWVEECLNDMEASGGIHDGENQPFNDFNTFKQANSG